MLPPSTDDDVERNFEKFDEEMDSIDEVFNRLEAKVNRLKKKRGDKETQNENSSNEGSEVVRKKSKISEKSDSDNDSENQKSNKESDTDSTDDELAEIIDKDTDWYIPKSDVKKTVVLKVLYVIKDTLSGNYLKEPQKSEIYSKMRYLEDRNPEFTNELKDMGWTKLRGITKAMWRKLKKDKQDKDLNKYKDFIKLSEKLWEVKLTEYLNF